MSDPRFPSNAHTRKAGSKPQRTVEKVTKGMVKTKKKPISRRFKETFFTMDLTEAIKRAIVEILIPDTQGTVSELMKGTIDLVFYGDRRGGRRTGSKAPNIYHGAYQSPVNINTMDPRPTISKPQQSRPVTDTDLVFDTREDAEDVYEQLALCVKEYGVATCADLYSLAGITANFVQNDWGWYNLEGANIQRQPDGWLLDLPRPCKID